MIPFSEKTENAAGCREWKNIRPAKLEPERLYAGDAGFVRLTGITSAVDGADGGADYEIRDDVMSGQRLQQ